MCKMEYHLKKLLFSLLALLIFEVTSAQEPISEVLRSRLENSLSGEPNSEAPIRFSYGNTIHKFYSEENFQPVWIENQKISKRVDQFIQNLEQVEFDGLKPEEYHLERIKSIVQEGPKNDIRLAELELILTDSFFKVTKDLHQGKVDHNEFKADWEINSKVPRYDYLELLREVQRNGDIARIFQELHPDFFMYENGRKVLKQLSAYAKNQPDDWKKLSLNGAIKVGQSNELMPEIRERLAYWKFMEPRADQNIKMDSLDMVAVKAFQKRNGMNDDGVIGRMTIDRLNYSPQDLINIARVNMERLRWLPDTVKTGQIVLVNIANYQMDFLNDRDTLLTERVIVGKRYHESPIFAAQMSYIVFSPYWNIPYSITHNEILPKARKDPAYISAKNMEIVDNSGKVISANSVDWESGKFPYRIRQKPGETNSLGLVKFIFPNNHSVYLHDTPARYLFEKEERAMSHGCIRVENPADLAAILLRDDPGWTQKKIYDAMHQSTEKTVYLKNKIPVVLLYLTFWADTSGRGHYRPDIYARDEALLAELDK